MVKRGQVWWGELGIPTGSEPGFRRPVLILQADRYNGTGIRTIVVAAITSNLGLADMPGNVFLPRGETGMAKDSVANVSQLKALDKSRLTEKYCTLPPELMRAVEEGVRLLLDL